MKLHIKRSHFNNPGKRTVFLVEYKYEMTADEKSLFDKFAHDFSALGKYQIPKQAINNVWRSEFSTVQSAEEFIYGHREVFAHATAILEAISLYVNAAEETIE